MDRLKRMKSHEYTGPEVCNKSGCKDRGWQGRPEGIRAPTANPLRRAVLLS